MYIDILTAVFGDICCLTDSLAVAESEIEY